MKNLIILICLWIYISFPAVAIENADLLPNFQTPVIDLAKSLNDNQKRTLENKLNEYESSTGWRIKVLTQYEKTPGSSIKDYWDLNETSLVLIADARGGNLLNFNVGEAYFALMPRIFWVELQTRYGNQFFVRENGEDGAILDAIDSITACLDKGGCTVVPGLPKEQWLWTLCTSILGGIVAGISSVPNDGKSTIAWKWLLLMSPLWLMLFGVFGLAPVITRTNDLLPLSRNIVSFIACYLLAYNLTKRRLTNMK